MWTDPAVPPPKPKLYETRPRPKTGTGPIQHGHFFPGAMVPAGSEWHEQDKLRVERGVRKF